MTTPNLERMMAETLVEQILAAGYLLDIKACGETQTGGLTNEVGVAVQGLWQCDEEEIAVYNPDEKRIGSFWLIWDNGADGIDLIYDYTMDKEKVLDGLYEKTHASMAEKTGNKEYLP